MSLWNDSGVPVSATLRVSEGDNFELRVKHLDSKDGGSEGWIAFRGSARCEPLLGTPDRMRIVLHSDNPTDAFAYDERVLNRASIFAFGCLKRVGGAVLNAFRLEIDTVRDIVFVEPRAAVLRFFWDESVGLQLTAEKDLWRPHSIKEGYVGPLPKFSHDFAGALALA